MFQVVSDLFANDNRFRFGVIVLGIVIVLIIASFLVDYNPRARNVVPKNQAPSLSRAAPSESLRPHQP